MNTQNQIDRAVDLLKEAIDALKKASNADMLGAGFALYAQSKAAQRAMYLAGDHVESVKRHGLALADKIRKEAGHD